MRTSDGMGIMRKSFVRAGLWAGVLGCVVMLSGVPALAEPTAADVATMRAAAEGGDAEAQNNLGVMYYDGQGIPQNHQEAVKWFRKAAEQGDAAAQHSLGRRYALGQGIPQNDTDAYFWAILASVNGDENSVKLRDLVAQNLTPEQRTAVQSRAAAWQPSKPE
jgi:TPR repeat protein